MACKCVVIEFHLTSENCLLDHHSPSAISGGPINVGLPSLAYTIGSPLALSLLRRNGRSTQLTHCLFLTSASPPPQAMQSVRPLCFGPWQTSVSRPQASQYSNSG